MPSPKQAVFRPVFLHLVRASIVVVLLVIAFAAFAADASAEPESPDWLQLGLGLFGGLALFLSGLQMLSDGLTKAAGDAMREVLAKLTTNRIAGAATGAFVTGVLNSSTVTTLLVVGFVSSGLMTLTQSVGVIMGANIGSTVTAQLLAFDLAAHSLGPVALGFFMVFGAKRDKVRHYGMMTMGIGLVFYGMGLMGDSMAPLRTFEPFLKILEGLENPVAGIIAGAAFTAVVQSSAATVGLAIAVATEGLLALPAGVALALGANIGTAVTTGLMGFLSSKSTEAVRTSVVHVLFNVIGVIIWLPIIWLLVDIAIWVSPSSPELTGSARAAAEVPRQIANANTLFNVINTVLFIGFAALFARAAEWLVRERAPKAGTIIEPKFLDEAALAVPTAAFQQVRLELGRLGEIAVVMMRDLDPAITARDLKQLENIARRDDEIDVLEHEILTYLGKIHKGTLTDEESLEYRGLLTATDNLESLADVIETDIVGIARTFAGITSAQSDETAEMLGKLHATVLESLEHAVRAVRDKDQQAAESVQLMKNSVRQQAERLLDRKAARLAAEDPEYIDLVRLEMAFVDQMRRIYTLAKRIAKDVLPAALAERD